MINLLNFEDFNAIFVISNRLIKKRYYILYITINEDTLVEIIANILIEEIFRLYNLLILIVLDRES